MKFCGLPCNSWDSEVEGRKKNMSKKNPRATDTLVSQVLLSCATCLRRVKRDSETATLLAPNVSVWEHLGCEVPVSTQLTTWTALTLLWQRHASGLMFRMLHDIHWIHCHSLLRLFEWKIGTFSESGLCDKWFVVCRRVTGRQWPAQKRAKRVNQDTNILCILQHAVFDPRQHFYHFDWTKRPPLPSW